MPKACIMALAAITVAGAGTIAAAGGTTTLLTASLDPDGTDGFSTCPVVSADGMVIAFYSEATNLVADDTNGQADVFVHDRTTGVTTRVSVTTGGAQASGASIDASLSADGRYVAFTSFAADLVGGDANGEPDVFVHDRVTGETTLVSVDSQGVPGSSGGQEPAISGDGRFVCFSSISNNLVENDTNAMRDVFRHDRLTGETIRVSVDVNGIQADHESTQPDVSFDGSVVVFVSRAGNLDPADPNSREDIYVRDLVAGTTQVLSHNARGEMGDDDSEQPSITDDGRHVAFLSWAENLIAGAVTPSRHAYLVDRADDTLTLLSQAFCGGAGNGRVDAVSITPDARWACIATRSTDMIGGGTFQGTRVYLLDLVTHQTVEISVDDDGNSADDDSFDPVLSDDATVVIFESIADNLVPGDDNDFKDIFAHEVELPCPADFDADGAVATSDLLALLECWGASVSGADLDGDGHAGTSDLLIVLASWGTCPR